MKTLTGSTGLIAAGLPPPPHLTSYFTTLSSPPFPSRLFLPAFSFPPFPSRPFLPALSFSPFLKLPHSDPKLWALEAPVRAFVHKTTYAPMIYTALYIMFLMRTNPLLGQVGEGWALEILMPFTGPKKVSISTCPRNGSARIKSITYSRFNHRCINSNSPELAK